MICRLMGGLLACGGQAKIRDYAFDLKTAATNV
jgi:hypothetical protein